MADLENATGLGWPRFRSIDEATSGAVIEEPAEQELILQLFTERPLAAHRVQADAPAYAVAICPDGEIIVGVLEELHGRGL